MARISAVIPVFNNSKSLPELFKELEKTRKLLEDLGLELELIFVDDGSVDNSIELIRNYQHSQSLIQVVKLTRNFGAIAASKRGLSFVTGDAFSILAADLQDPPGLLVVMAKEWLLGNKYIICERQSREDPWTSKAFSWLYYKLIRLLVISNYPTGGFDITMMDRSLLHYISDSSKNVMTPLVGYWLGFTPVIIPYHRPARAHGKSGWTFLKKLKIFIDVVLGFSTTPVKIMSSVGFTVATLSFIYGFFVLINAIFRKIPVEGFASLATIISFLLGLIIFMLGILGEYLWRILDQLNKRPESVVEQHWSE